MSRQDFAVRKEADADFDEAVDYYLTEAGEAVASRFVNCVLEAHQTIADNPKIGSRRLSQDLAIRDLRTIMVRGFPYLVAYLEIERRVEILRLIHGQRDLSSGLFEIDQ